MDTDTKAAFDKVENKLHDHDQHFERLEGRFDKVDNKLHDHDKRFDRLESRFDNLEGRFDSAEVVSDRRYEEFSEFQGLVVNEFQRIDRRFEQQDQKMDRYFGILREDFHNKFELLRELIAPTRTQIEGHESQLTQHSHQLENQDLRLVVLEKKA